MNRSIGVFAHAASFSAGMTGRCTRSNAQWPRYSAPSAIQRRRISASADETGLLMCGGGMITSGSVLAIRARISLASGFPGTMAVPPLSSAAMATPRSSSLNPACRSSASGPWQAKQRSERIGRTSRLKSIRGPSAASAANTDRHRRADRQARRADVITGAVYPIGRILDGLTEGNTRVAVRRPSLGRENQPSNADLHAAADRSAGECLV